MIPEFQHSKSKCILFIVEINKSVYNFYMDIEAGIMTALGTIFTGSFIGGLSAVINQAKKNTSFDERLSTVEDEKKEASEDMKQIKDELKQIQIDQASNNATNTALLQNLNQHVDSISKSTARIHTRLDNQQPGD